MFKTSFTEHVLQARHKVGHFVLRIDAVGGWLVRWKMYFFCTDQLSKVVVAKASWNLQPLDLLSFLNPAWGLLLLAGLPKIHVSERHKEKSKKTTVWGGWGRVWDRQLLWERVCIEY
jgi:hypothetical protein